MYSHVHTHVHTRVHILLLTFTFPLSHTFTFSHTCTHMYIHMCTHMCTHTLALLCSSGCHIGLRRSPLSSPDLAIEKGLESQRASHPGLRRKWPADFGPYLAPVRLYPTSTQDRVTLVPEELHLSLHPQAVAFWDKATDGMTAGKHGCWTVRPLYCLPSLSKSTNTSAQLLPKPQLLTL